MAGIPLIFCHYFIVACTGRPLTRNLWSKETNGKSQTTKVSAANFFQCLLLLGTSIVVVEIRLVKIFRSSLSRINAWLCNLIRGGNGRSWMVSSEDVFRFHLIIPILHYRILEAIRGSTGPEDLPRKTTAIDARTKPLLTHGRLLPHLDCMAGHVNPSIGGELGLSDGSWSFCTCKYMVVRCLRF